MKRNNLFISVWFGLAVMLSLTSCAYTNKTKLPHDIKTVYVETVLNKIDIQQMYSYQPGLEMDLTNALIRRFQVDGNLKVVKADQADAILSTELIRFDQEGVRFNPLESVSEYRLFITLKLTLKHRQTGEIIWTEPEFTGSDEYFVTQIRPQGQKASTEEAIENVAKRAVDRVTEDW